MNSLIHSGPVSYTHLNGYTINIVDTPGHADFGGEVERVMKMVDGVLLLSLIHISFAADDGRQTG